MHSVLFIGHEASRTGAPTTLLSIIRECAKRGVRCRAILLRGGPLLEQYNALCDTTVIGRAKNGPQPALSSSRVVREFRRITDRMLVIAAGIAGVIRLRLLLRRINTAELDCIYLNSAVSSGIINDLVQLKVPIIAHIHELPFAFLQSAHPNDLALMLSASSRIIVPCKALHTYLSASHSVPAEKLVVLPEPTDDPLPLLSRSVQSVRSELGIAANACVIAMAGTIDWRKGIDLFIALGRMLAPLLLHARFVWIGGGKDEHTFRQTWRHLYGIDDTLAQRFIFTGERTDVSDLLSAIDILALTSREDPCPLVHIEAAMLRKPIVCFEDAGGVPEWIGDAGIAVPYQNVAAMAEAVMTIATNPARAHAMGEAARTLMIPRFHTPVVLDQIERIMEQVARQSA